MFSFSIGGSCYPFIIFVFSKKGGGVFNSGWKFVSVYPLTMR